MPLEQFTGSLSYFGQKRVLGFLRIFTSFDSFFPVWGGVGGVGGIITPIRT